MTGAGNPRKNGPDKRLTIAALLTTIWIANDPALAADYLVTDQDAYWAALKKITPGDRIVLADGIWRDFEIIFDGKGKESAPLTLTAQTPGKVILSGSSNLRLGGEFLHVSGLVFKDGHSPTNEVISFRINPKNLANNSRVTNVVIDNFNQSERREVDTWIAMYGRKNRFDHNHIVGKRNKGVTLAVRLNSKQSQRNHHRIDHNYFGPRQILGSNGGETIRIGTSQYSLTDSFTTVENNYFDRTNGELEVISNKSGRNIFRNNTFYRARGTLTLRHGNNNLVEKNVFFGGGAHHTGGIRVINAGQTVRNNYMEGLTGSRFGAALAVMNGVPNSVANRYHQVKTATITHNSLINSDHILFAAGSDKERSAVPVDSVFTDNLIVHNGAEQVLSAHDDVSGIHFSDNIFGAIELPTLSDGFRPEPVSLQRAGNGLLYPAKEISAGASRNLTVTEKDQTGVAWYPKSEPIVEFGSGETIIVTPSPDNLFVAVSKANAGDTLLLEPGNYHVSKILRINKPVSIKASGPVSITYARSTLFEIVEGGSLQLIGLHIYGGEAPDHAGNSVIRTSPYSMLENYRLEIFDSHFRDLDVNHSFNVIAGAKGTFADHITIHNSSFRDVTGTVLKLDKERDDYGVYNAEYVTIANSNFTNIQGALVDFYRGGTDESTFGPHFTLTQSTLEYVGRGQRNRSEAAIHLHGVQVTDISDNKFRNSGPVLINHTVGEPKTRVVENVFVNTPLPHVYELNSELPTTATILNNEVKSK